MLITVNVGRTYGLNDRTAIKRRVMVTAQCSTSEEAEQIRTAAAVEHQVTTNRYDAGDQFVLKVTTTDTISLFRNHNSALVGMWANPTAAAQRFKIFHGSTCIER